MAIVIRLCSLEELGSLPELARKQEDEFRSKFMDVVAGECERQGAPRCVQESIGELVVRGWGHSDLARGV